MKFVIQRVRNGSVQVEDNTIGSIDNGLLVLVGIGRGDSESEIEWMINKLLHMRIFEDEEGKMNESVTDVQGDLLLIPNFTLYGDATQGNRPGFTDAEAPDKARELFNQLVKTTRSITDLTVEVGEFGAYMEVSLVNDGPVTIILEK